MNNTMAMNSSFSDEIKPTKRRSEEQIRLDKRAAQNLYRIWTKYKQEHKVTQDEFAQLKLGWSQGNFSQYLNGKTPIGRKSLLKLCEAFGCQPGDIREEFRDNESYNAVNTLLAIVSKHNISEEDQAVVDGIRNTMAA